MDAAVCDYIATKKVIASALGSIVRGTSELYAFSGAQITAAMRLLVDRAGAIGDIRPNIDPSNLLRALSASRMATPIRVGGPARSVWSKY
jgi:hypothetical protein